MSGYACYLERPVLLWQHEIAPCPAEKKKSTGQGAATKMARVQVGAFPLRTIRSQIVLSWICMAADPTGTLMQASGMPTSPTSVDGGTHDNAVHTLLFVF